MVGALTDPGAGLAVYASRMATLLVLPLLIAGLVWWQARFVLRGTPWH